MLEPSKIPEKTRLFCGALSRALNHADFVGRPIQLLHRHVESHCRLAKPRASVGQVLTGEAACEAGRPQHHHIKGHPDVARCRKPLGLRIDAADGNLGPPVERLE